MASVAQEAHLPALDSHRREEVGRELQSTLVELVDLSLTSRSGLERGRTGSTSSTSRRRTSSSRSFARSRSSSGWCGRSFRRMPGH